MLDFCLPPPKKLYVPTVFETYVVETVVKGVAVELGLWDTSGEDDYDRLRPLSYPDSDVVLVCFSVEARTSLENVLLKWIPEVRRYLPL